MIVGLNITAQVVLIPITFSPKGISNRYADFIRYSVYIYTLSITFSPKGI